MKNLVSHIICIALFIVPPVALFLAKAKLESQLLLLLIYVFVYAGLLKFRNFKVY